jgi:hypothetical protein
MKHTWRFTLKAMTWALLLVTVYAMAAHAQDYGKNNQPAGKKNKVVQPAAVTATVTGSGTTGQITKWARQPEQMRRLREMRQPPSPVNPR